MGLAVKSESSRARNRCCFVRESDRKPDLSRCPVRVFGPFLPHLSSCPRQYHYPKGGTLMGSKIYVGGLPYSATEQQLSDLFTAHGSVESARVITDKFTGQSRGFGFVEMSTAEEAQKAISALNGTQMDGRPLTANEAKPQEPRSGGASRGYSGERSDERLLTRRGLPSSRPQPFFFDQLPPRVDRPATRGIGGRGSTLGLVGRGAGQRRSRHLNPPPGTHEVKGALEAGQRRYPVV